MRAFKVTGQDAASIFTRFRWPTPTGGEPGAWVEATDDGTLCERGVHACNASELPSWLGPRLWEIELGGEIVQGQYKLVAQRGRLIRQVPGWPELARPFAESCARRVGDLAIEQLHAVGATEVAGAAAAAATTEDWQRVASAADAAVPAVPAMLAGCALDCWWDIDNGYYTMCAYVAATAFGCASTGTVDQDMESPGWHQERATQARWLTDQLDLTLGGGAPSQ